MAETGPLAGIRVLDLSRVLAGPVATQLMGDLGADVIKVERPGSGDDTRRWGPPWLPHPNDPAESQSAYFLSANRNKRSLTIDLSRPEGQDLVRALAGRCDVLVENFKVGDLEIHVNEPTGPGPVRDALAGSGPALHHLALACDDLDATATEALAEFAASLRKSGVDLVLARVKDRIRDTLARGGLIGGTGQAVAVYWSVDDAVQAILALKREV